jgi:SSS family solute:Na+ symporter
VVILLIPSVISIWYTLGTLFIPGLLVPIICNFTTQKYRPSVMFIGMVLSFGATLIWFIIGIINGSVSAPVYFRNIQPFFIGLFTWAFILPFAFERDRGTFG